MLLKRFRRLIEFVNLSSHQEGWKIALIEEADTLSISAHNALLKTLEEPPSQVMIILLARRTSQLPATILSRCRMIKLDCDEPTCIDFLLDSSQWQVSQQSTQQGSQFVPPSSSEAKAVF